MLRKFFCLIDPNTNSTGKAKYEAGAEYITGNLNDISTCLTDLVLCEGQLSKSKTCDSLQSLFESESSFSSCMKYEDTKTSLLFPLRN